MMIENSTPVDENAFGGYGEFGSYDVTADWSDEDWRAYDAQVAQEIADFEAQTDPYDEFYADDAIEPPF